MLKELRNTLKQKAMMNKTQSSGFTDFIHTAFDKKRSQSREMQHKFKSAHKGNTALNSYDYGSPAK